MEVIKSVLILLTLFGFYVIVSYISPLILVSVIQEVYAESNCSSINATFTEAVVGCTDSLLYNCSSNASSIPIPAGDIFVVESYYEISNSEQPNCTGKVQFFSGRQDETCFKTGSRKSEFLIYPFVEVYQSSGVCDGEFTVNRETIGCLLDEDRELDSFKYYNTSLIGTLPSRILCVSFFFSIF
jgi:hypothetical protein